MKHADAISPKLLSLVQAMCDDTIDDSQLGELQTLLLADPRAREFYIDLMNLDAELERVVSCEQQGEAAIRKLIDAADQSSSSPIVGLLDNATHGMSGYFSTGWPVAYLVAAVILSVGLFVGSFVQVSSPVQVVNQSVPLPSSLSSLPASSQFVGRITGMVDCKWADPSTAVIGPVAVPLGRKYALASGLMEITYDTGAKVILQGPCTYEVESKAGGFLLLGKLTARVEKKEQQRTENEELLGSNSSFLIPHSYFAVRTPTATVTDLGTEFGVDVGPDGANQVQVFQGHVELRRSAHVGGSAGTIVLSKGQSASVAADGREMSQSVDDARGNATAFIRQLPRASKCIDLLDIVAGGDGASKRRQRGIDPTSGADEPVFVSKLREGNGRYSPVSSQRLIDGVFVPNGGNGPVQLDSVGHLFAGFPKTNNTAFGSIWARDASGQPNGQTQKRRHWICAMGRGDRYMPSRSGLLCLNPNAGISFDLAEIRRIRPDDQPARFHAIGGMAGRGTADVWVFVDGQLKFERRALRNQDGPITVGVILTAADRVLTLVATDGDNNTSYDWLVFGDPVLQVVPRMEEPTR